MRRVILVVMICSSAFALMEQLVTGADITTSFQRPNRAGVENRYAAKKENDALHSAPAV